MDVTSAAQFEASEAGTIPELERVRDDVWAVPMVIPDSYLPYSYLYLLRDSECHVHIVDPGWETEDNWRRFRDALDRAGADLGSVRSITASHMHPDHVGLGARIRKHTGAPLLLHQADRDALDSKQHLRWSLRELVPLFSEWGVPEALHDDLATAVENQPTGFPVAADRALIDGDVLDIPGFALTVMWTPGHTGGSVCLRDDVRRILFTGDNVLPHMHPGIGLGGITDSNPLADYFASLEMISNYPDFEVLPGHGYRFRGVAGRISETRLHHLRRAREVASTLQVRPSLSIWDLASELTWTAGWENLVGFFVFSALSQTAIHREYVLAGGAL